MDAATASLIIALIPLVTNGAEYLIQWVEAYKKAKMQTNEWSPRQEMDYQASLRQLDRSQLTDAQIAKLPLLPPAA